MPVDGAAHDRCYSLRRLDEASEVTTNVMAKIIRTMATLITIASAAICFGIRAGNAQYYGDAPWCAVVSVGTGSVVWYCYYRSVEECAPNVIAGTRGFCNLNPYWSGSRGAKSIGHSHRRTRHDH